MEECENERNKGNVSIMGCDHGVRLGNVKISDLHDFKEHPFHVVEDTALFELAKSIEDTLTLAAIAKELEAKDILFYTINYDI